MDGGGDRRTIGPGGDGQLDEGNNGGVNGVPNGDG